MVKQLALENNLRVYQPEKLNKEFFENCIVKEKPDIVLVADYGLKVPGRILEYPKYGCVNVHPSLLPKYRGSAPVNWVLIRGEKITGVTTILMDKGWDTGDILLQKHTPIYDTENAGMLLERLSIMSSDLLIETAYGLFEQTLSRKKQDHSKATFAPVLKDDDGLIKWSMGANDIVNLIRGLTPVPGTYTYYKDKMLKIFSAKMVKIEEKITGYHEPGEIVQALPKKGFIVKAGDDSFISIIELQPAGKRKMLWRDFLCGYRVKEGHKLTERREAVQYQITKR